jgi:mannose-6-phosphate isomerase-like protein (cupin superfamily)
MSFVNPYEDGVRLIPETRATLVDPAAVDQVSTPASNIRFLAPGSLTSGRYGLFHYELRPATRGARPHIHTGFSESFYVLSGRLTVSDGTRWATAGAGSFLYVPERSVHGFRNDSDDSATFLVLFAPAPARELFFREVAEIATSGRTLSDDEWTELYRRHDQYIVPDIP